MESARSLSESASEHTTKLSSPLYRINPCRPPLSKDLSIRLPIPHNAPIIENPRPDDSGPIRLSVGIDLMPIEWRPYHIR